MIRVVIADDHPIALMGLNHFLTGLTDIAVAGEARNAAEVLEHARHTDFDVLLLDLSMPGVKGLDLLLTVREEKPALPVLVLSVYEESEYAVTALRAGAHGYLMKGCTQHQLIMAIRRVYCGGRYMSGYVARGLTDADIDSISLPHERLSSRQFKIFILLVSGKSISDIATILQMSAKTVSTHKSHVMQQIGTSTVAELVRYAKKHGLLLKEQMP